MSEIHLAAQVVNEVKKAVVGKDEIVVKILIAILARGHILLEDIPGVGKTTIATAFSKALGLSCRRVQFTPDVMPSDLTGFSLYNKASGQMEYQPGALLCNLFLADELNRATSRTQSALLEAMEEGQTTIDGTTLPLPEPFLVLATQNPVERESTFMLPAAQLDRFFVCLSMGYPSLEEEMEILNHLGDGIPYEQVQPVVNPGILMEIRREASMVRVSEPCTRYMVSLVQQTRACPFLKQGASPRASRCLYQGSKAYAAMQGREYVIPEDIQTIWSPVMAHRLVLTSEARFQKKTAEGILEEMLSTTPVPPYRKELFHGGNGR